MTASPTASATPAYALTNRGQPVFAPVPVRAGQPLCLYFEKRPRFSFCQIDNRTGEKIVEAEFAGQFVSCFATEHWAPGIYLARIEINNADASSKTVMQKVAVLR